MIKNILLDLDDTILDFHKAEKIALKNTLEHFGIEATDSVLDRYHIINIEHWKRLEKGELTREQVKVGRYETLFKELGIEIDAAAVTSYYESRLAIGHHFIDGAEDLLKELSPIFNLYIVSNGAKKVQDGRMKSARIEKYFKEIFISEEIGYEKPDVRFFEKCFSKIPNFSKDETVIIGDSLTSDIKGGISSGIKTIWFNKNNMPNTSEISPDFEIYDLKEVISLLNQINA